MLLHGGYASLERAVEASPLSPSHVLCPDRSRVSSSVPGFMRPLSTRPSSSIYALLARNTSAETNTSSFEGQGRFKRFRNGFFSHLLNNHSEEITTQGFFDLFGDEESRVHTA